MASLLAHEMHKVREGLNTYAPDMQAALESALAKLGPAWDIYMQTHPTEESKF